ncbi:MAG: 3-phosphoserine/phosphohydroxythreonine transaminase [Chitinophagaceae bacterium]
MSKSKIYFGPGPAMLPQEVLQGTADAVLDYNHSGISILSIPHRGRAFAVILEETKARVLAICKLDANEYELLWLQGGGRQQFAMIPMNFLAPEKTAGFIDSGHWAKDAMDTAAFYGNTVSLCSSASDDYRYLPEWPKEIPDNLSYLYLTSNNTIYGTQWPEIPTCDTPLVVDMSSDIFSCARDYARCDLFFAVAQKNIGPAGVTLVVIRKGMLKRQVRELPGILSYSAQVKANSLLNTPPVSAIYTCLLNLRWIQEQGINSLFEANKKKAEMIYTELDSNPIFQPIVSPESRSMMNVVFRMMDKSHESAFLDFCASRNIEGIAGHRSVGGFRASLYNAVSVDDVAQLVSAMREFS